MNGKRIALLATLAVSAAALPLGPGVFSASAAPPTNDAFAGAEVIADVGGTVPGTNAEATAEAGEPDHAGVKGTTSVWYRWIAPAGGVLDLSTVGSDFDTVLGVYTGAAVDALVEIGSGDDACYPAGDCGSEDRTSRASVPVQAAVEYFIAVGGYGNAFGTIALTWSHSADTTAPSVALGRPGLSHYQTTPTVDVRWAGADLSGVGSYDVQVRVFRWNGPDGGWQAWRNATTATSANYAGTYGRSYCFRVRATDAVGNTSIYTQPGCVAVPLHSDHLIKGPGWFVSNSIDAFAGKFTWTSTKGARLFRPTVQAERLALIVTKCPTCGNVRVLWNNGLMKNVSLKASSTQRSVVVPVADWGWLRSGDVVIEVTSSSPRIVAIEGLAIYRD